MRPNAFFIFDSAPFHGAMVAFHGCEGAYSMFSKSLKFFTLMLGLLVLAAGLATFARAQQKTAKKTVAVTVTGCLQKGVVLDRFHLTGQNGKAYALRSSSIKLSDHVGQNVTIKGELKRDKQKDDYDFEGSEVNEGYGEKKKDFVDVEVTNLKVTGPACH
jgi:hypothetical protein